MSRERCCRKSTSTLCLALLTLLLALSPLQPSLKAQELKAQERANGVDYFIGAGALYDDNLFRQPAGSTLSSGATNLHRQDLIERVSAGITGSWAFAQQNFELKAHGDDNRFEQNGQLNNISGSAALTWDWRVGHRWTGQLGADYARALANFANNLVLDKDLLSQRGSFAGATFELGPHWFLHGDVRWSAGTHSAAVRRVDDDNIRTQKFGVELKLSSTDSLGWNYRHANASFAGGLLLNGGNFDRNYDESASVVWAKYALSGKTDLDCEGGYVRRDYPNAAIGNFTGATGRGTLNWHPGAKTAVAITGWRDLNAYIDAQSNYFVTRGASITPSWAPTEKITTSVAVSWERQNYIGSNPTVAAGAFRRDTVKSAQVSATYVPARALELDITYRREQRDSSLAPLTYVDNLAVLGVRLTF